MDKAGELMRNMINYCIFEVYNCLLAKDEFKEFKNCLYDKNTGNYNIDMQLISVIIEAYKAFGKNEKISNDSLINITKIASYDNKNSERISESLPEDDSILKVRYCFRLPEPLHACTRLIVEYNNCVYAPRLLCSIEKVEEVEEVHIDSRMLSLIIISFFAMIALHKKDLIKFFLYMQIIVRWQSNNRDKWLRLCATKTCKEIINVLNLFGDVSLGTVPVAKSVAKMSHLRGIALQTILEQECFLGNNVTKYSESLKDIDCELRSVAQTLKIDFSVCANSQNTYTYVAHDIIEITELITTAKLFQTDSVWPDLKVKLNKLLKVFLSVHYFFTSLQKGNAQTIHAIEANKFLLTKFVLSHINDLTNFYTTLHKTRFSVSANVIELAEARESICKLSKEICE